MIAKKIREYLTSLRALPEDRQKSAAVIFSGTITFLIVSSSFVIPGARAPSKNSDAAAESNLASPFAVLQSKVSSSFSDIVKSAPVGEIKTLISGIDLVNKSAKDAESFKKDSVPKVSESSEYPALPAENATTTGAKK